MKSSQETEVEPTPEEWKARALRAERGLYLINADLCESDYVYGDDGANPDDMGCLGDSIWEAAEIDLDEMPVPADVARRRTDIAPETNDRVLFSIYSVQSRRGSILAVGRANAFDAAARVLEDRWRELCTQVGQSTGHMHCRPVRLHDAGRPTTQLPGWSESELRALLLEHDPTDDVRIVGDRFATLSP